VANYCILINEEEWTKNNFKKNNDFLKKKISILNTQIYMYDEITSCSRNMSLISYMKNINVIPHSNAYAKIHES
jgi:hypothetical protein